ncbi:MAG: CAP domain-containing protein, partial [Sphingobacteriales bacterium]
MVSNRKFRYQIILLTALLLLSVRISLIGGGSASASDITVSSVLNGVNNERSQRNISTLRTDSRLSNAAQSKSADMITRKYFAHVDPDGHYIWDKIVADGYTPYTILGENLAIDFSDTAGLIAAWIDSPTHRANLLNPGFADQGMGVALGDTAQGQYSIAITNTFGAQPAATSQNTTPAKQTPVQTTPTKPVQNPTPSKPTTPAPSPIQKPQVIIKKGVTLSITNTETILHTNHFTLNGTISTNTDVQITDSADNSSVTAQPDPNGNFHYDYKNLTNDEHNFIASATVDGDTISTSAFSLKIDFTSPTIDPAKIEIAAGLKNN